MIFVIAMMLSWALYKSATYSNILHYERWPVAGDTMSYWTRDMSLRIGDSFSEKHQILIGAALSNNRDPLRSLFYLFFPTRVTLSLNGHLLYTAISAFLFFFALVYCISSRSGSFLYGVAVAASTFLMAYHTDVLYGVPSRLPDVPASFIYSASMLVLFARPYGGKPIHFFVSGLLLGLATLTRYHAWIYGAFMIGPVVTILSLMRYNVRCSGVTGILRDHALFVIGLLVVAGVFMITQAKSIFTFYSVAGYALNNTLLDAIQTTGLKFFDDIIGLMFFEAALFMFLFYIAAFRVKIIDREFYFEIAAVLWAAISGPLLILFIMRVNDDLTQTLYWLSGCILLSAAPYRALPATRSISGTSRSLAGISAGIALTLFLTSGLMYRSIWMSEWFVYPRPREQALYQFNRDLAEKVVVALPSGPIVPTIDTNFDYYSRYVIPTMQLHFHRYAKFANVFQIRQSQWEISGMIRSYASTESQFTGTLENDKSMIMPLLLGHVDVIAVLDNVDTVDMFEMFKDDYTKEMARQVTDGLKADAENWQYLSKVSSPFGTDVLIFKNKKRPD